LNTTAFFGDFTHRWAEQRPAHCAFRFESQDYSYAWLDRTVAALAADLAQRGVGRTDRVAYLGLNHPMMAVLLLACARRGAILVALNYRLTAHEIGQQLRDSLPKILFTDSHNLETAQTSLAHVADLDEACSISLISELITDAYVTPVADLGKLSDDLLLVYTSGTTGQPKGAVLTQNALHWNCINSLHAHDLSQEDRVLMALPMFHVGGLNIMLTPALHVGASVILLSKFDPGAYLKAVSDFKPTLSLLVPATITAVISHPQWPQTDVSCFRLINTGSSIVPNALLEALHRRGIPAAQVYGSTETAPIAICLRAQDTRRKLGSAGLPAEHCAARLINTNGELCKTGEVGEIQIRGANVMRGYWRNEEATRATFDGDWFKTGDLAHQDAEGYYWVVGRSKDMIISGGENIYPAEIEALMLEQPAIVDCAVIGMPDERWGEVPVLVAVMRDNKTEPWSSDVLSAFAIQVLNGKLAKFKWPKKFFAVSALPKTALGKVRKEELAKVLNELAAQTQQATA
jgi:fatty-acyl-CoA synthase